MVFNYEGQSIEVNVIKSNRKTVCIQVKEDGSVVLRAPNRISNKKISSIIDSKISWIVEKRQEIISSIVERKIENGYTLMMLGKEYPINIVQDENNKAVKIYISNGYINIESYTSDEKILKSFVEKWYRQQCLKVIKERVDYYQRYFIERPKDIKVKEQKRRWASCTYDNKLLFNWRCIMADTYGIDYIVVHEMCHFIHKNHSKSFYDSVKAILPDYEDRINYLKNTQRKMTL